MAQQIREVCDLAHEDYVDASETALPFSWRGKDFSVDLCAEDAAHWDRVMSELIERARKHGKPAKVVRHGRNGATDTVAATPVPTLGEPWWENPRGASRSTAALFGAERNKIRAWARENTTVWAGLSQQGRIPQELGDEYTRSNHMTGRNGRTAKKA